MANIDKRIKKDALFELIQDIDMRSTGGPFLPAGTKGKVLVKHRKDQSPLASQKQMNQLWCSLDDGKYYYRLANDPALIRYIGLDPKHTPAQKLMDKCSEYGISQEQLAAAIRDKAKLRAEQAIQGGLQAQLEYLAQETPTELQARHLAEVNTMLQSLKPQI